MSSVGFLLFDGMTLLDFTGPAEVFGRAPSYEIRTFSPRGGTVRASNGVLVAETATPNDAPLDTLFIVGSDDLPDSSFDPELLRAAEKLTAHAERVATVCTGAFILAELGLLDGRRVATHWQRSLELERRYPTLRVEHDLLHVHDGRFHSSAGISAGIDLALALIELDRNDESARAIAQDMVVFMHRPGGQTQFATATRTPTVTNPIVQAALRRVDEGSVDLQSSAALARAVQVSERHLTRLFKAELGLTPAAWLERHRLGLAQQAILDGHSITGAAQRAGYGSDESLRRSFHRTLGISPSEYRRRFRSTFR